MSPNVNKTFKRLSKSFVSLIVAEAVDVAETTAEGETAQQTIQKADPFGILFAPSKCPKGYQKVGSTCRRTYD